MSVCMCVCYSLSRVWLLVTPWTVAHQAPVSMKDKDTPGKNIGVGFHSLLQGSFPTQRSNPDLPHCRQIIYYLSHQGSPRILKWVPIFSPGDLPNQRSNPGLLHCRWILYQLSHQGSPRILKWVPIPSPVDLPDPRIKPGSPALQTDSLPTEPPGKPTKST